MASRNVFGRLSILALVALLLAFPFLVGQSSYFMGLAVMTAIYATAAMSLNLLTGFGGQISVGHGGFLMLGSYTVAILSVKVGLPIWVNLPCAGLMAAFISLVIGLPAVRLRGHFLAVATLGFGLSVPLIALNWQSLTEGYSGLLLSRPQLFSTDLQFYYVIIIMTLAITWLLVNVATSRLGRAFRAIKDSEIAAASNGINVARYKTLLFIISSFFTGIAGGLYAYWIEYVSPGDFTIMTSFLLLAMIVVGGLGSIWGSIIGAILFTIIPHFADTYVGVTSLIVGLAVILIILLRPAGLSSLGSVLVGTKSSIPSKP